MLRIYSVETVSLIRCTPQVMWATQQQGDDVEGGGQGRKDLRRPLLAHGAGNGGWQEDEQNLAVSLLLYTVHCIS